VANAQKQSPKFYSGTATELLVDCRRVAALDKGENEAVFDVQRCGSYLRGFADGISVAKIAHPQDVFFCLPTTISEDELTRVVVKYAEDHPEQLHVSAPVFVLSAYRRAYPCRITKP
jgi:hypothetical protein